MKDKIMFVYKGSLEKLIELGFWKNKVLEEYYWSDKKGNNRFPYKIKVEDDIIQLNTPTLATIAFLMQMYKGGLIEITTRKAVVKNLTRDELLKENERLRQRLAELENKD